MQWFPGASVPGVSERTERGLSFGVVLTASGPQRLWHGDDFVVGADGLATVFPGPAHKAAEAELAARQQQED